MIVLLCVMMQGPPPLVTHVWACVAVAVLLCVVPSPIGNGKANVSATASCAIMTVVNVIRNAVAAVAATSADSVIQELF